MVDIYQQQYQTIVSLMTTELNSLTNNSRAISGAAGGDTADAQLYGDFELVATWGTNPSSTATVDLYLIPSADGTNYADGDASVAPSIDLYVGSFRPRAVTTAQRMVLRDVPMPPGLYKAVLQNLAGQTTAASGNTLKCRPHSLQSA